MGQAKFTFDEAHHSEEDLLIRISKLGEILWGRKARDGSQPGKMMKFNEVG